MRMAVAPNTVTEQQETILRPADETIAEDARALSAQLKAMRERLFAPASAKSLRTFTSGEAARLVGVSDGYLRQLSLAGEGPAPVVGAGGRRYYSLSDIDALRHYLADQALQKGNVAKARSYVKWRDPERGEHLQIISVTNFKGGSGKTTSAVHLAQYLAMTGHRVLAVDLDPQASLSALFGYQPELDLVGNDTIYGAIRYDAEVRPLREIIRKTYFHNLDLLPGNLELQEFEHVTPRALAERKSGDAKSLFFARVQDALHSVADDYDVVVIDCPPQLGYLTLSALCASTSVIVTVHPQMLDVASMSQFLFMTSDLLGVVREAGGTLNFDFLRYLVTRFEPNDGPQAQIVGFLRSLFGGRVLTSPMVKSTAISDAGLTKQTLYEVGRENFSRGTYDRAIEALESVNAEIEQLIHTAWGRKE
ncbi:plasmid partitioning protein RepA [Allorhizobium taibaishanense]|uniref:Plasmid partitioning protein RepA n=2 Tax=Allorhizobium taibaishanense TaxID=887144 RepID=A0A1Q9A9M6_9HYPH|nr:plasmid partitioning protein RepA [Allorhizobium taibaishanense]OLP51508.1 plasmid partitioning protein RepA [Allorhizobium taibaishanense]